MNTNITEAACLDFLRAEHARLALPQWSQLSFRHGPLADGVGISGHVLHGAQYEWVHGMGANLAEAHADFVSKMPLVGAALAAKMRSDAAKLLAEAAAIEAGKEVDE